MTMWLISCVHGLGIEVIIEPAPAPALPPPPPPHTRLSFSFPSPGVVSQDVYIVGLKICTLYTGVVEG